MIRIPWFGMHMIAYSKKNYKDLVVQSLSKQPPAQLSLYKLSPNEIRLSQPPKLLTSDYKITNGDNIYSVKERLSRLQNIYFWK